VTPAIVTFWILALLAVGSASGLVVRRNPIHGALFLVVHLATLGAFFLQMRAEFLAAAQVIVYAGAIAVLFVFAIMVLIPGKEETGPDPLRTQRWLAVPVGALLLIVIGLMLRSGLFRGAPAARAVPGGVAAIGQELFTGYLYAFEVTSVLLLAALVGVIALTKRRTA
jgi:NADH-quinone oxidoreductase subunit J